MNGPRSGSAILGELPHSAAWSCAATMASH